MPYARARRVLSNFRSPSMPGGFGGTMGVNQGFFSPVENWSRSPTYDTGDPAQGQPSQPPEGAASAGRTGVQQGTGMPTSIPQGEAPPPSPSFGRETLRNNPFSSGVQQGGVKRPLAQARRFGL